MSILSTLTIITQDEPAPDTFSLDQVPADTAVRLVGGQLLHLTHGRPPG